MFDLYGFTDSHGWVDEAHGELVFILKHLAACIQKNRYPEVNGWKITRGERVILEHHTDV